MKSDFHFHFYSRLVIMAVLAVSIIFIQQSVRTTAQIDSYPYEITGWAWAASAGWLSLNCYNDFNIPGKYEYCATSNYGLTVDQSGNVEGCAWAGNALNNGGDPLGWVCFSDPGSNYTAAPVGGIATSTTYVNALDQNSFASIVNQEHWQCVGGSSPGTTCLKSLNDTDCGGGICTLVNDGAWKLGFPILTAPIYSADSDLDATDIEGCFNCYEEYDYACSLDGVACTYGDDATCDQTGNPQTCSVITAVRKNCDNCLEYFYYPGSCENSVGGGSHISCDNTDDCPVVANPNQETCQPIGTCYTDIEQACGTNIDCGVDAPCIPREVGSLKKLIGGYDCTQCNIESYNNVCGVNAYQGNINSCQSCVNNFYAPGIIIDHKHYNLATGERAAMCGWAWNAWNDGIKYCSISGTGPCNNPVSDCPLGAAETCEFNTYGLGWFQFGPRVVTSTKPYLSIEGGNIYSKGDIRGKYLPPFGHYNASYLIESGGSITNFVSNSTLAGSYQGEFSYRPIINFPSFNVNNEKKYSNALGSIDYTGIVTNIGGGKNKYGSKININLNISSNNVLLGGEVYYYTTDLNIPYNSTPITVKAGSGVENASGVIIVNGNLTINRDVVYETGASYSNFKNIPSLVWLIKGDLTIDAAVTDLAGTFVVLGKDAIGNCNPVTSGCGQIITCDSSTTSCEINPLTIQGSVLARYFDLGRLYVDPVLGQASERFINDGRLQANPPSGFEDFSNVIPRFSEN